MDQLIDTLYPSQLSFKGLQAGGTSWNGVDIDVLKSGIQKYVRRGKFEKAIWCAYELDLFHEMLDRNTEKQTGLKALSTNLIHRLLIISVEDIGDPSLVPLMNDLVRAYKNDRFNPSLKHQRREYLYTIVKTMCSAERSRELSHIRCVFSQVFGFDGQEYSTDDACTYVFRMSDLAQQHQDIYMFDRGTHLNVTEQFQKLYIERNDGCFYWFFKQGGDTMCMKSVGHLLSYVIDHEEDTDRKRVMCILRDWFKGYDFKEYILFAMYIILLGIRQTPIEKREQSAPDDEWEAYYMINVEGKSIHIDDFVIDKHTRAGKKKGKDLATFASEGAFVTNESRCTNQRYKEIYTAFRQYHFRDKSTSSKEIHTCEGIYSTGVRKGTYCSNSGKNCIQSVDGTQYWYCGTHTPRDVENKVTLQFNITHRLSTEQLSTLFSPMTPRGQLLTGKHKKQVLIPREGEFKGYVIKGPWKGTDLQRLNMMLYRMRVMNTMKVRCVSFSIVMADDDNGYTMYKNLSPIDPVLWRVDALTDNNICTTHGTYGMDILRIDRSSMGVYKMSDLQPQQQRDLLFGDQFIFKGLVVLALLQVGDVGLYNILVSDDVAHIIDYDENTSRVSFSSVGHFFAKSTDKYNRMFHDGIRSHSEKIRSLIQDIDHMMPKIIQAGRKHGVSHNINTEWVNIKDVLGKIL